ncbi:hypothetical protein CsSME_00031585 [Camellia sinensis var. sinensis]
MASFFFCPLRWFLVLFHHIVEWAGNSERSEQGREGSLFGPNRTGTFCVKTTVTPYYWKVNYFPFWQPDLKSSCGSMTRIFFFQFMETPMDIKPSIIEGENFYGNLDNPECLMILPRL